MKLLFRTLIVFLSHQLLAQASPVIHWTLDESEGIVAADSSGNALDGTWAGTAGAPGWNPGGGIDGGSVIFSGADGDTFIHDGINNLFDSVTATPFTFSIWVKTVETQKDGLIYLGNGAAGNEYYILFSQGSRARIHARNTADLGVAGTSTINDGEWHHILGVYAGPAERMLYVDGVLEMTDVTEVPEVILTRFGIGGLTRSTPHAPVDLYAGELDDAALWDRALTQSEVLALNGLGVLRGGNAGDLESLILGFEGQSTAQVSGRTWEYATGLAGGMGATGGSVALRTAFIVLDESGNGMQMDAMEGIPVVSNFSSSATSIYLGESATLSWETSDATTLSIDGGIGVVAGPNGTEEVSPTETTTYTLTASNGSGTTTGEVTVIVIPEPVVVSYSVTPTTIFAGEEVVLSWQVENFTSLEIDSEVGVLTDPTGSLTLTPTETTSYLLTATNDQATVTSDVAVTVYPTPPPRELLLHWPLEEGAGTTTADPVGGHTGTFVSDGSTPLWDPGFLGAGSLTFENLANVSVRTNAQLVDSYPFSMGAWVKTANSENDTVVNLGTGDFFHYHSLRMVAGFANATTRNGDFFEQRGPTINDDTWHYIVGVFSHQTSMSLYVDGVLVGERTTDSGEFMIPDRFAIGALDRTDDSVVDPFGGSIDDVSFWNGILSASEVASLNGGAVGLGLDAGAMATILDGFESGGSVLAAELNWSPTSGLTGGVGTTTGSLIEGNATIVLDEAGNGMSGTPGDFIISSISRDENGTTLTWNSSPGAIYRVEFSTDLIDWSEEVDDNVVSQGTTTSFTDTTNTSETVGFYRVVR